MCRQWHPTPVLLPGKSHGWRSLVGCSPWGHQELDTTEWLHFHFHALEKEMATHSSVLAWRIPGTGEPGGLLSVGSHGVGHDWSDLAAAAIKHYLTLLKLSYRWKPCTSHMAYPIQLGLQDATSPIIEELLHFHDHALIIVFLISSLVLYIISLILTTKLTHTSTIDAQEVETIWTILAAIILILIKQKNSISTNSIYNRWD